MNTQRPGAAATSDPFDVPTPPASAGGPRRDGRGRYLLPDPDNGREKAWTRATTWASTVADTYGLTRWQMRMVAKGIAIRPDLLALAAAAHVDDRVTLDRVAADAKEAAGSSSGANAGTALHNFTERLDSGERDVFVPDPWRADLDAYRRALATAGITTYPDLIERIVVVQAFTVAGTFDRIVRTADGVLRIADLKTGKDLSYSWGEIAIQLALYAHADAMWDSSNGTYEPMPPVSKDRAVVFHLPVGKAHCGLYEVDIAAGWEMAERCGAVRRWRSRKDLATPLAVAPVPLLDRINDATTEAELVGIWQSAEAAGAWTDELTDAARTRKTALAGSQP